MNQCVGRGAKPSDPLHGPPQKTGSGMLSYYLHDEERQLVEKAQEFGQEHFTEENVSRWYREGGIPDSVAEAYRCSDLGYLGFKAEQGGPDVSHAAQIAVLAELTRSAGAIIPFQSQILDFQIVSRFANEQQIALILDRYRETSRPCFSTAISDVESGSDLNEYKTAMFKEGDRLILRGEKVFVANGQHTPYIMVMAKDLTESCDYTRALPSFWLIPASSEGVSALPINKIGQKMIPFAALRFDDVEVQPEWRLGTPHQSMAQFQSVVDFGRCIVCGGSLGLAQAAFEDAVHHANARKIRNRRIGDFQQIGLMLTDMNSKLVNMEAHIYHACHSIERETDAKLAVALMKKYVPETAGEVAAAAMQVFGGTGYTDSSRVGRIWIDSRGGQYAVGTDQIMVNIASRAILDKYAQQ